MFKKVIIMGSWGIILLLFGAIPRVFNYQGKLLDSSGVGVNDSLDIEFRLYAVDAGGEPLWVEPHTGVNAVYVRNGLFSVELGNLVPFPDSVDFSVPYWLEVKIGDEVFSPREKLVAVPYCIRAGAVERIGGGLPSKVAFWTESGSLGYDSGFHWDIVNRRLGIGTTSPSTKLQVVGSVRASGFSAADGTAGSPSYYFANDGDVGLFRPAADQLAFTTGGIERMRINNAGYVGLGTISPAVPLHVVRDETVLLMLENPSSGAAELQILSGGYERLSLQWDGGATMEIGAPTAEQMQFYVGDEWSLTLKNNGNIGVGVSDPQARLDVQGQIYSRLYEIPWPSR